MSGSQICCSQMCGSHNTNVKCLAAAVPALSPDEDVEAAGNKTRPSSSCLCKVKSAVETKSVGCGTDYVIKKPKFDL